MTDDRFRQAIERLVTREELEAELERTIGAAEREEVLSLVRWFTRRYPTPEGRLAYVRRAYARWTAAHGKPFAE